MRSYPAILLQPAAGSPDFSDLAAAALDGSGVVALEDTDGGAVRAFFQTAAARSDAARELRRAFPGAVVTELDVPDENWAERSQASLQAIRAGDLVVAPPWDVPASGEGVIVILPSMGFGTGHHATTRLCLLALQKIQVGGASVLDVGTGSGVLAIAAAKLGASAVAGIDNDPDAIANAIENRELNQVQVDFRCEQLENTTALGKAHEILLANLTGAVLTANARTLEALTAPGGHLILSGLRDDEEHQVLSAFEATLHERECEEGWVCLVLRREP